MALDSGLFVTNTAWAYCYYIICYGMTEGRAPNQTGFTDDWMKTMNSGFSSLMPHSLESGKTLPSKYDTSIQCWTNVGQMLDQCWANVVDGGPTLVQHWVDVSCLLSMHRDIFYFQWKGVWQSDKSQVNIIQLVGHTVIILKLTVVCNRDNT